MELLTSLLQIVLHISIFEAMIRNFWIMLLLGVGMCSCRSTMEVEAKLFRAESNLTDNSETALQILDSLDVADITTRKLQARYALVYSEALDKNYIDVKSDSIIAPAIKYYKNHGSTEEKLKSMYYYARTQYNAGDYNPAILTLMGTLPLVETTSSTRTCALVHNLFAMIYNRSFMFQEALNHIKRAHDYALQCGDYELVDLFLYRQAQLYKNLKQYHEAEGLYVQVLTSARLDNNIMAEVMCSYAHTLLVKNEPDYDSSAEWYKKALAISPTFYDANHWGAYAYALKMTGDENTSESVFSQLASLNSNDKVEYIYNSWNQMALVADRNYEEAYVSLSRVLPYQDSILTNQLQNSAVKAQRDYWILQNDKTQKEKYLSGLVLTMVILLLTIAILVLYLVYKRKMTTIIKEKELLYELSENINRQLDSLRTANCVNEEKLKHLRQEYIKTYKSQFHTLGELCETYVKSNEYNDSHKMVYNRVKSMVKHISGDDSNHYNFEHMINSSLDNIMIHFREDFPSYSEFDYRFVSYTIVGFDATTMCVILGFPSKDAVYMKKMRIKRKIQKSASPYKELYLEMMC